MRLALILMAVLVAVNTFLGDGHILRHIGMYAEEWAILRVILTVVGTFVLAILFIDIAADTFLRFPFDLHIEDKPEEEEQGEEKQSSE